MTERNSDSPEILPSSSPPKGFDLSNGGEKSANKSPENGRPVPTSPDKARTVQPQPPRREDLLMAMMQNAGIPFSGPVPGTGNPAMMPGMSGIPYPQFVPYMMHNGHQMMIANPGIPGLHFQNQVNMGLRPGMNDPSLPQLWSFPQMRQLGVPNGLPNTIIVPPSVMIAPKAEPEMDPALEEDDDGGMVHGETYDQYKPSKLALGLPHPDPVVETASLASVNPPDIAYQLTMPESIGDEGMLSSLQLEAIVYASQRHETFLGKPAEGPACRAGYLIGDGAGVGKGRTIAGIIYENWLQGRKKAIWLSVSNDLKYDAERDLEDIGADIPVYSLNKCKYAQINGPENDYIRKGVMFVTYPCLIGESMSPRQEYGTRMKQLMKWVGDKFDGVLVFDECHRAKNLCPSAGTKPTKTGLAVLNIQDWLPKARVIYASATGASEPRNMAYMSRLGLWGPDTPFADFAQFHNSIEKRGVSAMEVIAMDMKLRGMYIARQLSFSGVTFDIKEVPMDADYCQLYDECADLWTYAHKQFTAAALLFDADKRLTKLMWGQFWGAHQRFFKYLCLSSKVKATVQMARDALKEGKCVVIGLQSTGEARTLEQLEDNNGVLNDFVSTSKAVFQSLVDKHFPAVDRRKTFDCMDITDALNDEAEAALNQDPDEVDSVTGRPKRKGRHQASYKMPALSEFDDSEDSDEEAGPSTSAAKTTRTSRTEASSRNKRAKSRSRSGSEEIPEPSSLKRRPKDSEESDSSVPPSRKPNGTKQQQQPDRRTSGKTKRKASVEPSRKSGGTKRPQRSSRRSESPVAKKKLKKQADDSDDESGPRSKRKAGRKSNAGRPKKTVSKRANDSSSDDSPSAASDSEDYESNESISVQSSDYSGSDVSGVDSNEPSPPGSSDDSSELSDCSDEDATPWAKLMAVRRQDRKNLKEKKKSNLGDEVGAEQKVEDPALPPGKSLRELRDEAQALKDDLLKKFNDVAMRLPNNTLDDLIDRLGGPSAVAEMTGRKGRVVTTSAGTVAYEARNDCDVALELLNLAEKQRFMDGEKVIAIISEAASSGISLQADRRAKNQRRRVHITLELPWSADRAIQQFGRTHRSNQVSAPEYMFLITDLAGEKRFASAVARRLECLGALTHGDRRATDSRDLSQFNIDSKYGRQAVEKVLHYAAGSDNCPKHLIPTYKNKRFFDDSYNAMIDVGMLVKGKTGYYMLDKDVFNIGKFLNRLLGMKVAVQNAIFEMFTRTMESLVEIAKREGRFEMGIVELGFGVSEVAIDRKFICEGKTPWTKAQTILYSVAVERGMSWDAAKNVLNEYTDKNSGFYLSNHVMAGKHTICLAVLTGGGRNSGVSSGRQLYCVYRPNSGMQLRLDTFDEVRRKGKLVKEAEAAKVWNDMYENMSRRCVHAYWSGNCKVTKAGFQCDVGIRRRTYSVLSGSVLSVWEQIGEVLYRNGSTKRTQNVRVRLPNDKRIVGIIIPNSMVDRLLDLLKDGWTVKEEEIIKVEHLSDESDAD